jgi:hypothetical protein
MQASVSTRKHVSTLQHVCMPSSPSCFLLPQARWPVRDRRHHLGAPPRHQHQPRFQRPSKVQGKAKVLPLTLLLLFLLPRLRRSLCCLEHGQSATCKRRKRGRRETCTPNSSDKGEARRSRRRRRRRRRAPYCSCNILLARFRGTSTPAPSRSSTPSSRPDTRSGRRFIHASCPR